MAAVAERHEVLLVIRTTMSGGLDVVGHRRLCKSSLASAQFAPRMLGQERLAHLAPGVSVAFAGSRIALKAFVGSRSLFRMLGAVPTFGQPRASRVAARSLGLVGHALISFGQKESPGGIPELFMDLSECTVA